MPATRPRLALRCHHAATGGTIDTSSATADTPAARPATAIRCAPATGSRRRCPCWPICAAALDPFPQAATAATPPTARPSSHGASLPLRSARGLRSVSGFAWSLNHLPETSSVIDHRHAVCPDTPTAYETRPRETPTTFCLLVHTLTGRITCRVSNFHKFPCRRGPMASRCSTTRVAAPRSASRRCPDPCCHRP